MNSIAMTCAGLVVSALLGHAQTPAQPPKPVTQKVTPEVQTKPKTQLVDVTRVGCLKAWQPGPPDATRMPEAKIGTYILTPLFADPTRASADMPTYVLVGGATVNFSAHLNHKVEISGVEAVAQLPPSPQEISAAPALRPENRPDTRTMPSLTVQSLKMISTACP